MLNVKKLTVIRNYNKADMKKKVCASLKFNDFIAS